uniref:Polypeptide N-acetylgalactosaminyltransferase n=1 Tax=Geotrypetes seraphini TaxID=260995 RepID=A0A6P8RF33_GEOSA|nr:polypeptide N-acetylgalactosaminyltransferase 5 [Geotrypetes seraphini]XP_033802035.1 polypeptide N-acetylgalactosaminyltransferase 5 [Geotrypetes seraphini]
MNVIRKFFRGSGRALAFIFVASVIWLLFDMAALKLSFNEINLKLLREDELVRRERGRFNALQDQERNPSTVGPGERTKPPLIGHESAKLAVTKANIPPIQGKKLLKDLDKAKEQKNEIDEQNFVEKKVKMPEPVFYQSVSLPATVPKPVGVEDPVASEVHSNEKSTPGRITTNSSNLQRTKEAIFKKPHQPITTAVKKLAGNLSITLRSKNTNKVSDLVTAVAKGQAGDIQLSIPTKFPQAGLKEEFQGRNKDTKPDILLKVHVAERENINGTEKRETKNLIMPIPKADVNGMRVPSNSVIVGKLPKRERIQADTGKLNNSSKNHFDTVTEKLKRNHSEIQKIKIRSKDNFVSELKSKQSHLINTKSENTLTANILASKTNLKLPGEQHNVVEGAASVKGHDLNLDDKGQVQIVKHLVESHSTHLSKDTAMHKVLTLDVTMSPRDPKAPGQFGRAAEVPKGKETEASRRWKEGNFNVYLSDLIPLDRAIDDTRPKGCSEQMVHDDLPSTSIIMCFVDEVWSTLQRSVLSVLNRSPPHLLKEIILVDDFSTKAYLKDYLDKYMQKYPKVRVLHLKERCGLIRARLAGANIATGDVLTFLDSHVECNVGWLEPLLERVHLNRKKLACPVIDVISDKDMRYMTVDSYQRGIFTWPMNFGWKPIPLEVIKKNKIKESDPIRCPVMAGGLFSIDRKYFYELGTYDSGLDVWGGENMELSFKVWMCGGEIEIIPCSRVGHIFRSDNPYSFPKDRVQTVERNLVRVAEVWLDEYKEIFYGHGTHLLMLSSGVEDLIQQKELRKSLNCKSFKWYLENVFPDIYAPTVRANGVLANVALGQCLFIQNFTIGFEICDVFSKNQQFSYTWLRLIKHENFCITPVELKGTLALQPCDNRNNSIRWLHKSLITFQPLLADHFVVEYLSQEMCLEVDGVHKTIRVNSCDFTNSYQKWQFGNYYTEE